VRSWPSACEMSSGSVRRCARLTGRSPKHVKVTAGKLRMAYAARARVHGVLRVAGDCRILGTVDASRLLILVRWRLHRDVTRSTVGGTAASQPECPASGPNAPPLIGVVSISEGHPPLPMRLGDPVTV